MLELLKSGEPFLFMNMGILAFAIALCAQRVRSLWFKFGGSVDDVLKQVLAFVEQGSYARALQLVSAKDQPIFNIFRVALQRANRSVREIRRAIEIQASLEIPKIKTGTAYMPQLSNLATLLGLIGTIRGLIHSFEGIAGGDPATRQSMLSQGISIAFYNTYFGLSVAVAVIFPYLFILGKQTKIISQMEWGSGQLVDSLVTKNAPQQHNRAA